MVSLYVFRLSAMATLCAAAPVPGQTVRGTLRDQQTGQFIGQATLRLLGDKAERKSETLSDSTGFFELDAPKAGRYTLQAERIGYEVATTGVFLVESYEVLELDLQLTPGAIAMAPLTVVAQRRWRNSVREFQERRLRNEKLGVGRFMTREQIEKRGNMRLPDLLRSIAGIRVVPDRRGFGNSNVRMGRSGTNCPPALFLDGIPLGNLGNDELLHGIPTNTLEGLEIYRGPSEVPPELRNASSCGAIVMWTRPGGKS